MPFYVSKSGRKVNPKYPSLMPAPTLEQALTPAPYMQTPAEKQAAAEVAEQKIISEYEAKYGEDAGAWSAALAQENTLISWLDSQPKKPFVDVEGYSPYTSDDLTGYEPYAKDFIDSNSPQETAFIKQRIDDELARKEYLSVVDNGTIASIGAGIVDPMTLLSIVIPAAGGATLAAKVGGAAVGAAADVALTEAALHSTQYTRTGEETAIAVGSGLVLGGAVGLASPMVKGAVSKWRGKKPSTDGVEEALKDKLQGDLTNKPTKAFDDAVKSVGAAQRGTEGTELAPMGRLTEATIGKLSKWISPNVKLAASESPVVREVGARLMSDNLLRKANLEGDVAFTDFDKSAETLIKLREDTGTMSLAVVTKNALDELNVDLVSTGQAKLTTEQFDELVLNVYRGYDKSDSPIVLKAVKAHEKVMKQYTLDMLNEGMLGDINDPAVIAKYLNTDDISEASLHNVKEAFQPMLWDFHAIRGDISGFTNLIMNQLKDMHSKANPGLFTEPLNERGAQQLVGRIVGSILDDTKSVTAPLKDINESDLAALGIRFVDEAEVSNIYKVAKQFNLGGKEFSKYQSTNRKAIFDGYIRYYAPRIELQKVSNQLTQDSSIPYSKGITEGTVEAYAKDISDIDLKVSKSNNKEHMDGLKQTLDDHAKYKGRKDELIAKAEDIKKGAIDQVELDKLTTNMTKVSDELYDINTKISTSDAAKASGSDIGVLSDMQRTLLVGRRDALTQQKTKLSQEYGDMVFGKNMSETDSHRLNTITNALGKILSDATYARLSKEYAELSDLQTNPKAKAKLDKQRAKLVGDMVDTKKTIDDTVALLDNTYAVKGSPTTQKVREVSKFGRTLTSAVFLAGTPITSLVELATPMLTEGVINVLGTHAKALVGNLSKTGREIRKLSREEQYAMSIGVERHTQRMLQTMQDGDVNRDFTRQFKTLGKVGDVVQEKFGTWSGFSAMTDFTKMLAGNATMARVTKVAHRVAKGKKLSKGDKKFIGQMGLHKDTLRKLVEYKNTYGSTFEIDASDGATFFHTKGWLEKAREKNKLRSDEIANTIETNKAEIDSVGAKIDEQSDRYAQAKTLKSEIDSITSIIEFQMSRKAHKGASPVVIQEADKIIKELSTSRKAIRLDLNETWDNINANKDDIDTLRGVRKELFASNKKLANERNGLWEGYNELRDTVETLRTATLNRVDSAVTTATKSDLHPAMHTEIGKFMLQFKSWVVAFTGRVLIPALQNNQGDMVAKVNFVTALVAMGFMGNIADYTKKELFKGGLADDEEDYEPNMGNFIKVGIENSGVFGLLQEPLNILEELVSASGYGDAQFNIASQIGNAAVKAAQEMGADPNGLWSEEEYEPVKRYGTVGLPPTLSYAKGVGKDVADLATEPNMENAWKLFNDNVPLQNTGALGVVLNNVESYLED